MSLARIALVVAAVAVGALARDAFVSRAGAAEDALRRSDVERIVRALEGQTQATKDLARAVQRPR